MRERRGTSSRLTSRCSYLHPQTLHKSSETEFARGSRFEGRNDEDRDGMKSLENKSNVTSRAEELRHALFISSESQTSLLVHHSSVKNRSLTNTHNLLKKLIAMHIHFWIIPLQNVQIKCNYWICKKSTLNKREYFKTTQQNSINVNR